MENLNFFMFMSLSGSVVVLFYYLLYPFIRWRFNPRWKRMILRMSIIFYLFPIPYLKTYFLSLLSTSLDITLPHAYGITSESYLYQKRVIFLNHNLIVLSRYEWVYIIIGLICIISAVTIVTAELINFVNAKRIFIKYGYSASEEEVKYMDRLEKKLHTSRKTRLLKSQYTSVPMTFGVWNPVVLLPASLQVTDREKEEILIHELAHIKNWDTLWHFFELVMISLHWFNPICYLAYFSLNELEERCSDESVVAKYNKKEKMEYCNTIIAVSSGIKSMPCSIAASSFTGRARHQIKRRIDEIMNEKRKSKAAAFVMGTVTLLLALGVILAYQPPLVIYAHDRDSIYSEADLESFDEGLTRSMGDALPFDDFFADQDNQVFPIPSIEQRDPCNHSYVDGTRKKHSKKADGSCVTKYYEAKRCVYCGRIESGDLYRTETYTKCPH